MAAPERFFDADQERLLRSPPIIDDYEKQRPVTLEEAAKKLQSLVYNCDIMMLTAMRKTYRSAHDLTVDEAAAICLYTMKGYKQDRNISIQLNRALRSQAQSELIPWFSYLKLFVTALNKLPPMKGTIWRCVRGDITAYYQNYCIWSGFSSCTETKSVLEEFIDEHSTYTIFKIECVNGKAIRNYSDDPRKDEVLLMPGTRLQVRKKEDLNNGLKVVHLQEEMPQNLKLTRPLGSLSSMSTTYPTDQVFNSTTIQSQDGTKSAQSNSKITLGLSPVFVTTHLSTRNRIGFLGSGDKDKK
ncbi:unnamed protein product [Rotaria sp. Silwood2]|nr:unnamed protein product [Rotaria sp. Silwood2]CAF3972898.1 unnamed protein product [Rotaria sp. Silwood2]